MNVIRNDLTRVFLVNDRPWYLHSTGIYRYFKTLNKRSVVILYTYSPYDYVHVSKFAEGYSLDVQYGAQGNPSEYVEYKTIIQFHQLHLNRMWTNHLSILNSGDRDITTFYMEFDCEMELLMDNIEKLDDKPKWGIEK